MEKDAEEVGKIDVLKGETCPFCHEKTLTLMESEKDIPFFGKVYLFSMDCSSCKYHKADLETDQDNGPAKYSFEISSEEDMKVRVIKSSTATVKIPHIGTIEPGESANGYVTNIEGVLNRMKKQIEFLRNDAEDKADVKKAKNMLKKLTRVMWGQEKLKISLDDPKGNSAIISDKAVKS